MDARQNRSPAGVGLWRIYSDDVTMRWIHERKANHGVIKQERLTDR